MAMRPSISMTLEPGLERGVLGRDLYTFVTSASGHMMRTLQKPRKNRPSKRQVNHRRFLHNMIQRKFADIEAANQREASTLHSKEEDKNLFSLPSQKTETLVQPGNPFQGDDPQDPDKCSVHTDEKGASTSQRDVSVGSSRPAMSGKKQPDSGHLWKRHPQCATLTSKKNNQSRGRQRRERRNHKSVGSPKGVNYYQEAEPFHTECNNDKLQLTKDSQTHQDSGFIEVGQKLDTSPSFSLELSPLSLASCDLSIQMFTDVSSTCAQTQRNIADISESPWTDIMDLFGVGSKDLGGCMDVEAYLESICACQGDVVQEVSAGGVRFTDHPESFCSDRCEVADLQHETGEYMYEYGYSCHGDQTINQLLAAETHTFNSFKSTDMIQNQVPESISHIYNTLEQHTYRHPREVSHCMLVNCENGQNFTPFEGIAQSFSVPLHDAEHRPISTPPQEEEWLFTDILKDRKSPNC